MTTGPALEGLDPAEALAGMLAALVNARGADPAEVAELAALILAALPEHTPEPERFADRLAGAVRLELYRETGGRRIPRHTRHPSVYPGGAPGAPCPCRNTTRPHRVALLDGTEPVCPVALDYLAHREDRRRVRVLLTAAALGFRVRRIGAAVWDLYEPEDLAELAAVLDAGAPIPEHLADLAELVTVAAETLAVALALDAADRLTVGHACPAAGPTARARPPGRTPTRRRVPCRAHLRARSSARSDDPAPTSRRGALVGRPGVSTAGTGARPPT